MLMFIEFKGLAALGTAELCLSRVQFQSGGCQCKLLWTTRPKMSACLGGAAFPGRERSAAPAQFETELWRKRKH